MGSCVVPGTVLALTCVVCLFRRAALEENAYNRMKKVVKWYLSGFYKKPKVSFLTLFCLVSSLRA